MNISDEELAKGRLVIADNVKDLRGETAGLFAFQVLTEFILWLKREKK